MVDNKFTIHSVFVPITNYQTFPSGPDIIQGWTQTFDPSIRLQDQVFKFL